MNVLKSLSRPGNSSGQPNPGRRSFLWKMSAAVSAAAASVVPGMSSPKAGSDAELSRLSNRLGILEDEKAIRKLHQTYEACLDSGRYQEIADLFSSDGEVVFNGGIFQGKQNGVSRLYRACFSPGSTGKRIGPAPGDPADAQLPQEAIRVAADRLSAQAQFPYTIQVGVPMAPDSQLVAMARLQGEGIVKWCESGVYEASYARDTRDACWKIQRLEYRVVSKTDYRPGRSYARPVSVPQFAKAYPEDPAGPDRLIASKQV